MRPAQHAHIGAQAGCERGSSAGRGQGHEHWRKGLCKLRQGAESCKPQLPAGRGGQAGKVSMVYEIAPCAACACLARAQGSRSATTTTHCHPLPALHTSQRCSQPGVHVLQQALRKGTCLQ